MLTKVLIFGLLCSTIIQAFPTTDGESVENEEEPFLLSKPESDAKPKSDSKPDSTSVNRKIPCADQIEWLKNTTLETKNEYEKYYKRFADNNIDVKNLSTVKAEHEHIEALIADSLRKWDVDLKNIRANVKDQWNICIDELKSFSIMNRNLSALAQSIRPKVIDLAKKLGLPPDTIDDLDHTLGRIVNFIFIIDMGKNTFRDIYSMVKEAGVKTEYGIKLENKYKFTEDGVEAIGELKEKERIGHIEEPAIGKVEEPVFRLKEGQEVVGKVEASSEASNIVDPDSKEFNDVIASNDPDIAESDKELEQREKQAEELRLAEERQAEEQRLAEEERLAEQEQLEEERRLQRKPEMDAYERKFSIIRV